MIRPRRDEDLHGCVRLLRRVHENEGYPANWPTDPERWLSSGDSIGAWVVADDDQLVLGHIMLITIDPYRAWLEWVKALGLPAERLAVVSRLFVDPDVRRRGLGRQLIRRVEQEADNRGLHPVLDVAVQNHAAIALYKDHGWLQVGNAVLPPGDAGHALHLRLLVAPGRSTTPAGPPST
jgi:GNAT superfamily N-acetyltransferase